MIYPENMDGGSGPEQQLPRIEGETHEGYLERLYGGMAAQLVSGELTREGFIALLTRDRLNWEHRTTHDGLTGLLNYSGFMEAFGTAFEIMQSGGSVDGILAFIDVDKLKPFNDANGHQAGNQLLKIYAEVINSHLEGLKEIEPDKDIASLVGRYGGDEFIFFLRGINLEQVKKMANSIVITIPRAIRDGFNDPALNQTISIGLTTLTKNDRIEDSIKRADQAMYAAKKTGNTVVVK